MPKAWTNKILFERLSNKPSAIYAFIMYIYSEPNICCLAATCELIIFYVYEKMGHLPTGNLLLLVAKKSSCGILKFLNLFDNNFIIVGQWYNIFLFADCRYFLESFVKKLFCSIFLIYFLDTHCLRRNFAKKIKLITKNIYVEAKK